MKALILADEEFEVLNNFFIYFASARDALDQSAYYTTRSIEQKLYRAKHYYYSKAKDILMTSLTLTNDEFETLNTFFDCCAPDYASMDSLTRHIFERIAQKLDQIKQKQYTKKVLYYII